MRIRGTIMIYSRWNYASCANAYVIALVLGLITGLSAGCGWLWPLENPGDPLRCDPACGTGQTCWSGQCVPATGDGAPRADGHFKVDSGHADQRVVDAPSDAPADDGGQSDWLTPTCLPSLDSDNDTINNLEEGCPYNLDSDGDQTPDYQDPDSDEDGIPDAVEAGDTDLQTPARDSDGDQYPDYLDLDSDDDGHLDNEEDFNGDGRVGCCTTICGEIISGCSAITTNQCGSGQTCNNGLCTPPRHLSCSGGESDPTQKDTFGIGSDLLLGNAICRPQSASNPDGFPLPRTETSPATAGDWTVVLSPAAAYQELQLTDPGPHQAAAVIDFSDSLVEVAGFVLSRPAATDNIVAEHNALIAELAANTPGGAGTLTLQAQGQLQKTHDKYDAVSGTSLNLVLNSSTAAVSKVRNELLAVLLQKTIPELGALPSLFGLDYTELSLRFTVVRRFDFAKDRSGQLILDGQGFPKDDGNSDQWRLLVIGAVAARSTSEETARSTSIVVDDLANGSALARAGAQHVSSCEVLPIQRLPQADIIWVMDESASMDTQRQKIADGADFFFSRAQIAGLDFRMGVTNVCSPSGSYATAVGKFCSRSSTLKTDDGGPDRFLLASEKSIFTACTKNPPGYEEANEYVLTNARQAIEQHLPRAANTPDKIRQDAELVVIVVTDEISAEVQSQLSGEIYTCPLSETLEPTLLSGIQPFLDVFSGTTDPEAKAVFHAVSGLCDNSCGIHVSHDYRAIAAARGGKVHDLCQSSLTNVLQTILDDIISATSPLSLARTPVSSTLLATLNGQALSRSRTKGFDYLQQHNAMGLINMPYQKGSVVVVAFSYWTP